MPHNIIDGCEQIFGAWLRVLRAITPARSAAAPYASLVRAGFIVSELKLLSVTLSIHLLKINWKRAIPRHTPVFHANVASLNLPHSGSLQLFNRESLLSIDRARASRK